MNKKGFIEVLTIIIIVGFMSLIVVANHGQAKSLCDPMNKLGYNATLEKTFLIFKECKYNDITVTQAMVDVLTIKNITNKDIRG